MFRWLNNLLTRAKPAHGDHPRRVQWLRARYDAAATNDENRRHWANADGLSACAANSPEVRRLLRNRARYEVANNCYARGLVLTLAHHCVGTGPRLQMLTDDAAANRRIEREFTAWAKAVRLAEKLRTMRTAKAQDGEAFGVLTTNPRLPTAIQLDLRLVEADQVTTPDLNRLTSRAVDGIVFDDAGNPIEYHVLKDHPGGGTGLQPGRYDRLPAESVVHWFRCDRPGQVRGVPELMPAMPLFAQLRRYRLAVLGAAELAASYAGVLYTDAPAGGEAESAEPFEPIEVERNALLTLPGGWKIGQMETEQPATSYGDFSRENLGEMGRCELVPLSIITGDSSRLNYASGRLDHQTYFFALRIEQSHLECVVLDRLLAAWFDEAVLIPGLLPSGLGFIADWPHQWFWDGHEHVDPAKEASAQTMRLANHTTTLADEYARRGLDWETQLRQRAKELELMGELGLTTAQAAGSQAAGSEDDDPEGDDPDDDSPEVEEEQDGEAETTTRQAA